MTHSTLETRTNSRAVASASDRLVSLDALRGFDMFWIVGGSGLVGSLINLTDNPFLKRVADQMDHVQWNGFHFWDLIFPLFLFLSGVTIPLTVSRRLEAGSGKWPLFLRALRRGVLLVALGMVYNGMLKFDWANLRYLSVLGHIGRAWFFAATIVIFTRGVRAQAVWFVGLLVAYWAAMRFIPVPGFGAGDWSLEGNLVGYIDRALVPGKLHEGVFDPEGLLATVPAVSTALMGAMAGHLLRLPGMSGLRKAGLLAAAGLVALGLGQLWGLSFPINKKLWTSSFILYAGGWSLLLLALFYLVIDVWGLRRWAFPFALIGLNPITIYLGVRIIDFPHAAHFLFDGAIAMGGERYGPALTSAAVLLVELFFLWALYRKKIFLRV